MKGKDLACHFKDASFWNMLFGYHFSIVFNTCYSVLKVGVGRNIVTHCIVCEVVNQGGFII